MTSSFRATGQASVRATPAAQVQTAGAWAPLELSMTSSTTAAAPATRAVNDALTAAERASLIDEGYARGLADGEKKALAAGQARVAGALTVLEAASEKLNDLIVLAPGIVEENITALAIIVARQIVAHEVVVDRTIVADLVRRALTEFPIEQAVRIRVHPVDLSLLTIGDASHDVAPITGKRDVTWVADPHITRGGVLLEGRDRIVDGRVDSGLERAYRRMAQVDAS
ncbi:MAG TPA: FliH/SctL family protein [Gemmatimonadaceae bacterium]|nr:FliH/SctL family protein [Gemmatimonadaceae bacterium]